MFCVGLKRTETVRRKGDRNDDKDERIICLHISLKNNHLVSPYPWLSATISINSNGSKGRSFKSDIS